MDKWLTFNYYLTAAIAAFIPVISSLLFAYFIDLFVSIDVENIGSTLATLIVVLLAGRYILIFLEDLIKWSLNRTYFDFLFRYKIQNELNIIFFKKIIGLDIAHLENPETQNLITKVRDTISWRPTDFMRVFSYFFGAFVGFIVSFLALISFGWWIPLLIISMAIPRMILRARYGRLEWSAYGAGAPDAKKFWYLTWVLSQQTTLREIKIFRSEDWMIGRLNKLLAHLLSLHRKPLDNYLKLLVFPPILETIVLFGLAYYKLGDVFAATLTIGVFTFYINMIDQLAGNVSNVVGQFGEMHEHNLYVNQFFEVLALQKLIKEDENAIKIKNEKPPTIEFKNVGFVYPNGKRALKNISFTIKSGENVALVGVNGAGKTTIVKLLCRFYDVTEGEILIDGINIKKVNLKSWYSFLGTLFQDFVQYQLSVKDNIVLGDERVDFERMEDAAKKSGAIEFIEKFPNKFDQVLGTEYEDGQELSGGQWQKLAITRAFYQQPKVLIMDEPTSAIDAEAEYEIFNNLEKEYKSKTLILVSHRFSTVRNANRIFVIDEGEVIESGTHQELMELNKKYAKMFKLQAKGYQA